MIGTVAKENDVGTGESSIVAALLARCRTQPDEPCVASAGTTLRYDELLDLALRWAAVFERWGLQPGDRVALFLENSVTFLAAYLGVHVARGTVVLVNTQYRQMELRHILSDSGARLCLTGPQGLRELSRMANELPDLEAVILAGDDGTGVGTGVEGVANATIGRVSVFGGSDLLAEASPGIPAAPDPSAIAIIGYTSGTTGRAKGAMLTHANLAANATAVVEAWHWTRHDRLLLTLPLFHVHGLCVGFHGTIMAGASADVRPRFDAGTVFQELLHGSPTMFFGVPTMYTRLLAEAAASTERPNPIRLYVSGSAPLSVQAFNDFARLFGQHLLERYGMTETLMNLTNPYDGERRPGTVGKAFPGQQARIVNVETRLPVVDRQLGEIQVRGPHVFKGYWGRPDATAAAFDADGWFNTGDLGTRSADGYFTISGRARELIISGGYNIYPREVEEVLLGHPAVAEVAVLGMPDADLGEQVVAVLVRRPTTIADGLDDELLGRCRDQLAGFKKPRRFIYVEALPRNALGKVQKHVLREQLETESSSAQS
jgi:malonyl-CoA/methylmalonyl-CoA synthetase